MQMTQALKKTVWLFCNGTGHHHYILNKILEIL